MIAVFGKEIHDEYFEFYQKIIRRIEAEGCCLLVDEGFYKKTYGTITYAQEPILYSTLKGLPKETSFLFSIGGDGTFLDSVHLVGNKKIPVLGFNFGRMGFLSVVQIDKIDNVLNAIFDNQYAIEERSLITLQDENNTFGNMNVGLNEVCFSRKEPYSLLTINVWVDGLFLNRYWGDGLIIATPTGSTAYSLSCAGPILCPDVKSFVLSPIASHNLTVGSIVIPDSSMIKVVVECREKEFCVNVDSSSSDFKSGSKFIVTKNKYDFNIVRLLNDNFFNTIREKLSWGIDVRN